MLALFLLTTLPVTLAAQTTAPNTGNIKLEADIQMHLNVTQPGGACWPGFTWHSTYGGCRRRVQEQQTETRACAAGEIGQQTRTNTRYNYILQSTGHVASDPWVYGGWNQASCFTPPTEVPTIANSMPIANTPPGVNGLDSVRLTVMFHPPSMSFLCYWSGGVYSPGPHDMLPNGFTDYNRTAWCVPQPDGSLHYGHSYSESFIVSATRRNASRVDFSYRVGQMLSNCGCNSGSSTPQFRGATHVITP